MTTERLAMHAFYFETHFRLHGPAPSWPDAFAIVTAWATTGETWSRARSEAADAALEAELRARGAWILRVTGYSPITGHAEPSWAAALTFDEACDLGSRYEQDAIYWVEDGELFVSFCDERRACVRADTFGPRVQRREDGENGGASP